jgi:hypothetical protein
MQELMDIQWASITTASFVLQSFFCAQNGDVVENPQS